MKSFVYVCVGVTLHVHIYRRKGIFRVGFVLVTFLVVVLHVFDPGNKCPIRDSLCRHDAVHSHSHLLSLYIFILCTHTHTHTRQKPTVYVKHARRFILTLPLTLSFGCKTTRRRCCSLRTPIIYSMGHCLQ